MKTMTEFDPHRVNKVVQLLAELETQGKTPEEKELAIGEALKLEGDKLKLLIKSAEHLKGKTDGLRKIVVMLGAEGEVGPPKSIQVDMHFLVVEYFGSMKKTGPEDREQGQGRRGKGRGGRDERGGGGGKGRGGERGGPGGGGGGGHSGAHSGAHSGDRSKGPGGPAKESQPAAKKD